MLHSPQAAIRLSLSSPIAWLLRRFALFDWTRSASCSVLLGLSVLVAPAATQRVDPYTAARRQMVQRQVAGRGIQNPRVIAAMEQVPRHLFVPANQRKFAYLDAALPLGHGQTITSPYVVSFMTEQLDPQGADRILEIGTGSGYQAAVLSRIVADVYSIEIVEPLGKRRRPDDQPAGVRECPH